MLPREVSLRAVLRRVAARRRRTEDGTALVEFTWLAILLMIPLVYIMLTVFDVQRGAFGVTAASRAAARAYSLAESDAQGHARAQTAAAVAMRDQGFDAAPAIDVSCTTSPACLLPGSVITVRVTQQVTLPLIPDVLGGGSPSFRVESEHTVPISQYQAVS